jgi:glycosyltransferase involved in cell wall biosynthesis
MPQSFTIVVCTRNRMGDLRRLLDNLAERCCERNSAWDVVVVDNASTDGTAAFVEGLSREFPLRLRVVREMELGLSHARNRGIREASGAVLVFLDDDIAVRVGWFRAYEHCFQDPEASGGGGPVHPHFPKCAATDYVRAVMADRCGSTGYYDLGTVPLVLNLAMQGAPRGGNMALTASVLQRVGPFRTTLGWGREQVPGEETDLFARCAKIGSSVRYLPDAAVDHYLQPEKVGWDYLRTWHIGYGRASVRMRPRLGPLMRGGLLLEQAITWLRYSALLLYDRSRTTARPYRKVWQAQGRIAELLGR